MSYAESCRCSAEIGIREGLTCLHRVSGYAIVILSLATICAATDTGFNQNVLHMKLWALIVASVLVLAGLMARIKKHKLGL